MPPQSNALLQYVKQDHVHETLVKIGAYILGEFGHLIAEEKAAARDRAVHRSAGQAGRLFCRARAP